MFLKPPKKQKGRTLLLVDEFNAQGHNSVLNAAVPVIRSMGLSAGFVIQDVESLRAAYKDTYKGFLGNSQFVVWMGTNRAIMR